MKWKDWLVWGLLAGWAIGLGACAAPEVDRLRGENERLEKQLAMVEAHCKISSLHFVPESGKVGYYFVISDKRWDKREWEQIVCIEITEKPGGAWCGHLYWKEQPQDK